MPPLSKLAAYQCLAFSAWFRMPIIVASAPWELRDDGGGRHVSRKLQVTVTSATHRGWREENEDSFLTLVGDSAPCGTLALLAVADGIGGQGSGASASNLALKTLADVFSAGCSIASATLSDIPHLLRFAVQKANAAVFQAQSEDEALTGMGTTCVAAAVTSDSIHLVSIGDSRAYLFREGKLLRLTEDEWVKEPDGVTVVSRAIGWQPLLPTEPISQRIRERDEILLCTDGLTDALPDGAIRETLASGDDGAACMELVRAAAEVPDADNVTVVLARLVQAEELEA